MVVEQLMLFKLERMNDVFVGICNIHLYYLLMSWTCDVLNLSLQFSYLILSLSGNINSINRYISSNDETKLFGLITQEAKSKDCV